MKALKFYATWCGPCKTISPFYHQLCEEYSSILFCEIDIDIVENIEEFEITVLPTFITLLDGKIVDRVEGSSPNKIELLVQSLAAKIEK